MTRRGMMGLPLTVPVEHFDAGGWSNSAEYRTRYPAKVVKARMVDGLKLLRYAKEMTFKTPERRYLCIASRECDGDHAPASARTFLSKEEVEHGICPDLLCLLDVRVEQLELEHDDKDGHCHVKVRGMECLECGDRFNTYLGDSYLCDRCHGPLQRFAGTKVTIYFSYFPSF